MKAGSIILACCLMFSGCIPSIAQSTGQAATIGALDVKEIGFAELDASHVKIAVNLSIIPAQTVTLRNLRLCGLKLNSQPVFAEPIQQEIPLKKGVPTAFPALYIVVLTRDLYTVDPLIRMIRDQKVHIDGDLVADLKLNFMEKLALGTQHPKVAIALDQDVPAATGTSEIERKLALSVLSVVDVGLKNKSLAAGIIGSPTPSWVKDLQVQAQQGLYLVRAVYILAEGEQHSPVSLEQFGFALGPGIVITTAEARAPWKYDAEFQGALGNGLAKLVKNSHDVQLLPAVGGGNPLKLSAKDFVIELRGTPRQDRITAAGGPPGEGTVCRRYSPGSMAILKLSSSSATPAGLPPAPSSVAGQDSWDQVVVFRRRTGNAGKPIVEALLLAAKRDGSGILLSEPVDDAVLGSPIVTRDGVIGMVQDEQSGTFLASDMFSTPIAAK